MTVSINWGSFWLSTIRALPFAVSIMALDFEELGALVGSPYNKDFHTSGSI